MTVSGMTVGDLVGADPGLEPLRLVIEAVPTGMLMIDRAGAIVLLNARLGTMFGYARGELIGQAIELLVPERLRARHSGHRARFVGEAEARRVGDGRELCGLRKDGSEIAIEVGLNPVRMNDRDFVLCSVVEISERKQRERDRAFLVEMSALLRTAPDAAALASDATETLARHMGCSRCALVQIDEANDLMTVVAEFVSPGFQRLPVTMRLSSRAAAAAEQRAGRTTVIRDATTDERTLKQHEDGYRPFGVQASLNVPLLRDGRWVASLAVSVATSRDWTQREIGLVQTVADRIWPWIEHLRLSAEHYAAEVRELRLFHLAVEAAQTGMILADRSGRIVLVNARTERLFGYSREELIGAGVELLIPERFHSTHPGFRASFLADPSVRVMGGGRDLFGRRKDGAEMPIEIGLTPLKTTEGDFVLSSVVDITDRKRADRVREELVRELQTLNAELETRVQIRTGELTQSLRERDALLQEVHHRVKNNLQVISSLISMQVRRLDEGKAREALDECQVRVQAIALIHEKLYQSRDCSRVAFSEYVRSVASNVFHATGTAPSRVKLELAIDDVTLAVDRAIPCGLVLNELITNALKHGFKDGRSGNVRVELTQLDGGRLRLAVHDNGVGLPAGFTLQTSESLGVRLVSTLSKQLDAELEVNGRGGTSFQLTFAAER
jgi:PAS domain S-box-containing protein